MTTEFRGKIEELDDGRFVIVVPSPNVPSVKGLKGQTRKIIITD
jgi:hypothetical protein